MLEKLVTLIEKAGKHFSTMWSYFKFAVREDQADKKLSIETGSPVPNPNGNVKNWIKIFGVTAFGLIVLFFVLIYKLTSHKPALKKSHHGINKYGERY
jgi:hypothetical protein